MLNDEIKRLISNTFEFINALSVADREKIFRESVLVKIEKNKIIMNEGLSCEGMVLVLEGVIRIYKVSEDGKEISLYRIGKGETCVLSVSCILGSTNYRAIAQAEEECLVLSVPSDTFKEIFLSAPPLQKFIFNALSSRLAEVMLIVEEIAFQRMDKRVAAFLVEKMAKSINGEIKITHEEIAFELGSAREVISRILKDFEKKGMVSLSRGSINVLKLASVKQIGLM